jgi:hypothetical protein
MFRGQLGLVLILPQRRLIRWPSRDARRIHLSVSVECRSPWIGALPGALLDALPDALLALLGRQGRARMPSADDRQETSG